MIHELADVQCDNIGEATKIWQFTVVLCGAHIGRDCNICAQCFIENDVVIGDNVTIKNGVQVWDGLRIEDNVFVGPNVTFTNDLFPRSKQHLTAFPQTVIQKGASIGANATLLSGITVGRNAMIGAGAVVTKDVPPNAIVVGSPAHITGYVSSSRPQKTQVLETGTRNTGTTCESAIAGVQFYNLPVIVDMRGSLSFAEIGQFIPFQPKRYFLIFDIPSREIRGEHAHKTLHQFLVCVKGSCAVVVDDGLAREEYVLDSPGVGIHVPPNVWAAQYKYSPDAVLLVLASDTYDPDDYIRDYNQYLEMVKKT